MVSGCDTSTCSVKCRICLEMHPYANMQQFLPCFHLFCKNCINVMINYQKTNRTISSRKLSTNILTCPTANCQSQMRETSSDSPIVITFCENMRCPRKLSQYETTRLNACQHEICTSCLEESLQRQPPGSTMCNKLIISIITLACIVENCNRGIVELEEIIICDGCGKSTQECKSMITTVCCKCHFCEHCVDNREKENVFDKGTLRCAEGKCPSRKKKGDQEESSSKCKAKDNCQGIALSGFPSNLECSHEVCIQCLEEMISECEITGGAPMCPQPSCHLSYTVESVNALRTLLPQKAEYFQRFDLDERKVDVFLKDESITLVDLSSEFDYSSRQMTIRVVAEGEEDAESVLVYDSQGTIGDFIREVRGLLKIMPYEKVYGYFIQREDDGTKESKEPDEEITIDGNSVTKCISALRLTPSSIIRVNTAGIVQQKSSTNISKSA